MDSASLRSASASVGSNSYVYPEGPESGGEHSYAAIPADGFTVRGPRYLDDRVKVPAGQAMFDLMHVSVFRCNDKIGNVAARSDSWLRAARAAGDTRYYLVVVYVTPAAPYIQLIFYYAVQAGRVRATPNFAPLWRQFTAHGPEADAFRNERWKVIPRVAEGPWAVSYAVGTKPALLAQKLTHTWVICDGHADVTGGGLSLAGGGAPPSPGRGGGGGGGGGGGADAGGVESVGSQDASCGSSSAVGSMGYRSRGGSSIDSARGPGPYIEADCDVASSSMAFMLVSLLQSSARYLVIDLCFTIEPREDDCLPEVAVGTIRLSRVDTARPPLIEAERGDWVLGTKGATYGNATGGEEAEADASSEAAQ